MRAVHVVLVGAFFAAACGGGSSNTPQPPAPTPITARMDFTRASGFYTAPFPSDDLRTADGHVDLSKFPNPMGIDIIRQATTLLADAHGFAQAGGVHLSFTDAIDATKLPDLAGSVATGAEVFLVSVDAKAPDYRKRYPIYVTYEDDGGPFGTDHLLSIVPLQGHALRPATRYAAVVLTSLGDAKGAALGGSDAISTISSGKSPAGMNDATAGEYRDALASIALDGVQSADMAALAVFTTDDTTGPLKVVADDMLARPLPALEAPLSFTGETFPTFCVYTSTIEMPSYQSGSLPYNDAGQGAWHFDASGKPIFQSFAKSRVVVTIPRAPMPAAGYPTTVLIRTGAGGDRPLVDRGVQPAEGQPPITPGTGPAIEFARAGFAGVQIDGPQGGPYRNPTNQDEQFLMFNVAVASALRDNIRQSAAEIGLLAHILDAVQVSVKATDCAGVASADTTVKFDTGHLALMGHSMGAWIAPLVLSIEPRYKAAILSGAGASWIENVIWKKQPTDVAPIMEILLGYDNFDPPYLINPGDPSLTMIQWGAEAADPQIYGRLILNERTDGAAAPHVLMEQGIVDHYILPRIANATSLAMGLDGADPLIDETSQDVADEKANLRDVIAFAGHSIKALPLTGNLDGKTTAVVVQHKEDGKEDGHEVVFQEEAPKHQYVCFLKTWLANGTPTLFPDAAEDAPCE